MRHIAGYLWLDRRPQSRGQNSPHASPQGSGKRDASGTVHNFGKYSARTRWSVDCPLRGSDRFMLQAPLFGALHPLFPTHLSRFHPYPHVPTVAAVFKRIALFSSAPGKKPSRNSKGASYMLQLQIRRHHQYKT